MEDDPDKDTVTTWGMQRFTSMETVGDTIDKVK